MLLQDCFRGRGLAYLHAKPREREKAALFSPLILHENPAHACALAHSAPALHGIARKHGSIPPHPADATPSLANPEALIIPHRSRAQAASTPTRFAKNRSRHCAAAEILYATICRRKADCARILSEAEMASEANLGCRTWRQNPPTHKKSRIVAPRKRIKGTSGRAFLNNACSDDCLFPHSSLEARASVTPVAILRGKRNNSRLFVHWRVMLPQRSTVQAGCRCGHFVTSCTPEPLATARRTRFATAAS